MSNALIGWPIYSDVGVTYTPALSGGSWLAAAPLTNVQDRRLSRVARSTTDAAADAHMHCDLGVARAVSLVSVHGVNFSSAAHWQVLGGTAAGASDVYDSGLVDAYPVGGTAENLAGLSWGVFCIPPTAKTARHWTVTITDTTNPDTYIEIGRLVIAGGIQPTINMLYGARLGLESDTTRTPTDGGAAIYGARPVRRTATFTLPHLPEAEALANIWQMMRIAGTSSQIVFIYDPADTTYLHERAFLAVLRDLSPMEQASYARYSAPFSLVEDL